MVYLHTEKSIYVNVLCRDFDIAYSNNTCINILESRSALFFVLFGNLHKRGGEQIKHKGPSIIFTYDNFYRKRGEVVEK